MGNTAASIAPLAKWEPAGPNDAEEKVSPPLRHVNAEPGPPRTTLHNGASTVWEMAEKAIQEFGETPAVGHRQLLKRSMEEGSGGKKFEKLSLSPSYVWMTYAELGERVEKLAAGLVGSMGLKKTDRVLIFAETQLDWMVAMLACFRQGAIVVTAYATLGEEGVSTSLNQTGAAICVCDVRLVKPLAKAAKKCPGLKYVVPILTEADRANLPHSGSTWMAEEFQGQEVKFLHELIDQGGNVEATPPKSSDEAVVMYTSGTTGNSKGVILSHENFVAQTVSALKASPFMGTRTTYLAYLPLSHIMELFFELALLSSGARIGYGSPNTLTDTGLKLAAGQRGDAPLLKPTLVVFAPLVLERVYAAVRREFAGGLKAQLFNIALASGYRRYDRGGVGSGLWDPVVMSRVRTLMGGNVEVMYVGSAPLSEEVQKFTQSVFNCPVRQGYGLTEACGAGASGDLGDNTLSQVGPPPPAVYLRLRDWEEGGYTNADVHKPEVGMRRGEVLIGGPTVAQGYLVDEQNPDPELVKKNFEDFVTIDGIRYFCTGDVGQVTETGCLAIIDRKKDLFKGENGEYVSLSKVESLLKLSSYVEMPMAYGRTGAKSVIALICPQKQAVMAFADKQGLQGDLAQLCKHKEVIAEVTASCLKECKAGGLNAFELPSAIALVCAPDGSPAWTPDNGLTTATMKLKRPLIAKAFAADIDECYDQSGAGSSSTAP